MFKEIQSGAVAKSYFSPSAQAVTKICRGEWYRYRRHQPQWDLPSKDEWQMLLSSMHSKHYRQHQQHRQQQQQQKGLAAEAAAAVKADVE